MPKGRLEYLKRLMPYLKNQSEDCLYLNIFAPLQSKWSLLHVFVLNLTMSALLSKDAISHFV